MGAQTPSGPKTTTSVHSDHVRSQAKAAKVQHRFENMDVGYQPQNPDPLSIDIGQMSSGQRMKDQEGLGEEDDDTLGDVQINDNFSIGGQPSSAQHS